MTKRNDAKLLQVLRRQGRQNRLINVVLAECPLVSFEAKVPQPSAEVHDNAQVPSRAYVGAVFGDVRSVEDVKPLPTMVVVGLIAAVIGGRALWVVPLSFVTMMAAGGALGMAGFALP